MPLACKTAEGEGAWIGIRAGLGLMVLKTEFPWQQMLLDGGGTVCDHTWVSIWLEPETVALGSSGG